MSVEHANSGDQCRAQLLHCSALLMAHWSVLHGVQHFRYTVIHQYFTNVIVM